MQTQTQPSYKQPQIPSAMPSTTATQQALIDGITARLPLLPPVVLQALYEIAVSLPMLDFAPMTSRDVMLASEDALARLWDTPEEDAAWAHLEHLPAAM